jgi:hypothetical protein
MRLINNASDLRTYENTAFGVRIQYPAVWGVVELKSSPLDNSSRGSSVALFTAPLENATDNFREKALLSIQDFSPTGEALERNMTLAEYTNSSLSGYRNISDSVTILESNVAPLAGQPGHRIVFIENIQGQELKKTQTWTVNDNKAYVITFSAQEPRFNDYLPAVENMVDSLKIDIPASKVLTEKILDKGASLNASNAPSSSSSRTGQLLPAQSSQNLTFLENTTGFQMQYPSYWTRVQPGTPLDDRRFAILVSFISPPEDTNDSSSGVNASSSISRVSLGTHDLRPAQGSVTENVTLEEYSSIQSNFISQQGARLLGSEDTKISGLPAREVSYVHGENYDKQTLQTWTLKGEAAYHFIFTADKVTFNLNLPLVRNMLESLRINE